MPHVLHCPECGTDKEVRDPEQQYCSQLCAKAAQRKARTGSAYRAWKRAVLECDNYTCKMCGNADRKNKKIADHIIPLLEAPELRLEPGNGQTLCAFPCHDIRHGTLGNSFYRGVFGNRMGREKKVS